MNKITKFVSFGLASLASLLPMGAYAMGMQDDSASSAAAGFAIFFLLIMLIFWVVIILLWVFWLLMVIDIAKRDWKNDGDRAAYLVLVILLNILGAIIYYFAVKRHLENNTLKK